MNIFSRKSKKGINVDGSSPAGSTKNEKSSKKSNRDQKRCLVLGVPLKQAVQNNPSFDGIPVPALVRNCLDYVTHYGLQLEGIYRVSPPKSRLDELEQLANSDPHNEIVFQDAHEAAGLLKRFLRQLPEDILTSQLRQNFDDIAKKCTCDPMGVCTCPVALQIKELLLQLPTENFYLLAYVFRHAQLVIQQESFNKMGLPALGVLLQAILNNIKRPLVKMFIMNASDLLSGNNKTGRYCSTETTLSHFLFDTVDTKPYIKPKSIEELRKNTPVTIAEIEEEIGKQQNLLEYLHEQVQQTRLQSTRQEESVKTKGEEMWAVQTGITVLRRRLKALLEQREEQQQRKQQQQTSLGHSNNAGDDDNDVLAMFNDGIDNGILIDGEDGDSAASTSMQMNTAALVEKQLLAVQMALLEEIADEKRKIAHLLSVLRELRNQLPEEDQNRLTIFQRATNDESQQRKSVMSIRSSSSNGRLQVEQQQLGRTTTPTEDALSQSSCNWEELCQAEESRREQLLADLIRYRRICSQLRARLEQNTMLVKLKQQQQLRMLAGPEGTGEVLLPTPIGQQQQQQQKPPPPISPKPDGNGNNDDGIVNTVTCTAAIAKNNTLHGINDSSASAVLIAREGGTVGDNNDDDDEKNKTRSANNLLLVTRF